MNATLTRVFPALPRAHSLVGARRLQDRYSNGRGGVPHVIVLGDCTEVQQIYFVVTRREARTLLAAGYELLDSPVRRSSRPLAGAVFLSQPHKMHV